MSDDCKVGALLEDQLESGIISSPLSIDVSRFDPDEGMGRDLVQGLERKTNFFI
jgi:hypothetical protein